MSKPEMTNRSEGRSSETTDPLEDVDEHGWCTETGVEAIAEDKQQLVERAFEEVDISYTTSVEDSSVEYTLDLSPVVDWLNERLEWPVMAIITRNGIRLKRFRE